MRFFFPSDLLINDWRCSFFLVSLTKALLFHLFQSIKVNLTKDSIYPSVSRVRVKLNISICFSRFYYLAYCTEKSPVWTERAKIPALDCLPKDNNKVWTIKWHYDETCDKFVTNSRIPKSEEERIKYKGKWKWN